MANPIKVIKLTGVSGSLEGKADVVHTHVLADITDAGTAAASASADFATASQGTLASNSIQAGTLSSVNSQISDATLIDTTDSRLSDARTPTTHSHTLSQITDSGSAAGLDVATVGNAAAAEVVKGNDTRLSDDRDPTAHTHTLSDISDSGTAAASDTTDFAGAVHAHTLSDISDSGTAAASDTTDFAQASHTHTLSDISDSGTAAAADTTDFAQAAHTHTLANITDGNVIVKTTDADISGASFVLNEATLVSNSQTKVPTQASVKSYVDNEILLSASSFKGAYNASTNTPDLTSPSAIAISAGDTYVVETEGSFYSQTLLLGTTIIAEVDSASTESDWTIVGSGLDAGTVKTKYESNADTNAFTDAEQTKLTGIETAATADQTGAEIKVAYEAEADTNAFTDAEQTKLTGIETAATADQTGAEIKVAYEAEADTNAFTDALASKLNGLSSDQVSYKGDFDPTASGGLGSPNLNVITSTVGDIYYVTAAGTYNFVTDPDITFAVGDVLIAKSSGVLSDSADWIVITSDITTDASWATKGDLIAATGAGAASILPAPVTDDLVLTTDAAEATGLKWAAPSGGLVDIVEDTSPELGGNLDVGNFEIRKSNAPFLSFTSSSLDEFSLDIRSGTSSGYGAQNPTTISVVDNTGSGFYRSNLKLSSASGNFGAASIELDNYVFQSNENLSGKSGQVLTYDGSVIKLAPAGGAASDLAYGVGWNGNQDAATKNAIYDKIETLGWDITTDTAFDAKGDLIVGTGNNTAAKLTAFPQDGKVLTTASGYATGLAWQDAATGGTTQGSSSTYDISAVARSSTPDARGNYSVDLQMQGNADDVAAGTHSALIGGSFNSAAGTHGFITAGTGNTIPANTSRASIISSTNCSMANSYGDNSVILAHGGNTLVTTMSSYNSAIIGGQGHTLDGGMGGGGYCAILAGQTNSGNYADSSIILGGNNNNISYGSNCVIAGTRVKATGVPLGRLDGVFAFADTTAADYTITQEKTANFRVANGMHISAPLFIDERASALADIAGRGQIWVKTATPNELWFTDDAGSDIPISEGVYTVATLPTGVAGRRAFVTDSGNTLASHHGQVVTNGGANFVPVYHDGSAWHVG